MNDSSSTDAQTTSASALQSTEHDRMLRDTAQLPNGTDTDQTNGQLTNGVQEHDPESEAETLITSPVKKAEAAKQDAAAAAHQRNKRVMTKDGNEQNGEADAQNGNATTLAQKHLTKSEAIKASADHDSDHGSSSEVLSDVDDDDNHSSDSSQHSRSASEQADAQTTNSRKRKHRASSSSFPNKRPSVDVSRRRKRGATEDRYDGDTKDRSNSPQNRNHRRAVSTQSLQDSIEPQGSRKRRSIAASRDGSKATRPGWDEESISSETTSLGQAEQKRPTRGVGRSTSTPGRPVGRETKRHVNKYGYTRLAEACETDDLDLVKEWREKDPDQLEIAEFAGNKPLQIAAINGNSEVVKYLIEQGCQLDCENDVRDTPLIDAAENGHSKVVQILLDAGVDPLRQNRKGQQALDVINDETDNVTEIRASLRAAIERWSSDDAKQRRDEEEQHRYRAGPSKELHFMARSYENLMRLVTLNDRNSVREFLDARVPVDNAIIAAAAKTGDLYLVNMLLAEMPEKKRYQKAEKPMLSVLGTSHFDMVKNLTELDQFNPRWTNRQDKTWSEIAEEKGGPMWRLEVELLRRLEKEAATSPKARQSSSPIMRRNEASSKARNSGGSKDNDTSDANGSEADTPRKPKNGRRLLSRKDMRAASGKKHSHGSDDSDSDDGESSEAVRRAPSPKEKRGPGRPRTKPVIVKTEEGEDKDKKEVGRRRSVSHRAAAKPSLPIVAEGKEAQTANDGSNATSNEANQVPPTTESSPPTSSTSTKQPPNGSTPAAADADVETATTRDDNEMQDHVDAMSQQEELERQHAAEQEQVQREMEQQMKAEADARVRELEEMEREREREEQRRKVELEQAKADARRQILSALPQSIALQLDPESDFSYQELGAVDTILQYIEPLQVVYMTDLSTKHDGSNASGSQPMVLNLLVAPLLGKEKGLATLLQGEHFPSVEWESAISVLEDEKRLLLPLLRKSAFAQHDCYDDEIMINGTQDRFTTELNRAARIHKSASQVYQKLLTAPFTLRWLPLQRIVEHLHPIFHGRDIAISENWRAIFRNALRRDAKAQDDTAADFFECVAHHWQQPLAPRSCRYGQILDATRNAAPTDGWTNVEVVGHK